MQSAPWRLTLMVAGVHLALVGMWSPPRLEQPRPPQVMSINLPEPREAIRSPITAPATPTPALSRRRAFVASNTPTPAHAPPPQGMLPTPVPAPPAAPPTVASVGPPGGFERPGIERPGVPSADPTARPAGADTLTTPASTNPNHPRDDAALAVRLPSQQANYLDNPPPNYPAISRRLGETGRVLVATHVSADGGVLDVHLAQSSGHVRLDEAALQAVRQWRFVPGTRAGVAEAMWVTVPIHFRLD